MRDQRGLALVTVLLVASLVFVAAVGFALMLSVHHLVARNHREALQLQAAAHAGVALAADGLARDDWQAVLGGLAVGAGSDGSPSGIRAVDTAILDLDAETHRLNCGRPSPCTASDRAAITLERPWGANNPFWRLYLFGPLASFAPFRYPTAAYVMVWVGDDGRETDGRPEFDGGDAAGRHVVRVRAVAVGRAGARRAVDAELVRVCLVGRMSCEPGIRVQSERELRHTVP